MTRLDDIDLEKIEEAANDVAANGTRASQRSVARLMLGAPALLAEVREARAHVATLPSTSISGGSGRRSACGAGAPTT